MLWVEINSFLAFCTRKLLRAIITACHSMPTVAVKLVLNSVADIFKYLQHFIRGFSRVTWLKFWSMSQVNHRSKYLSSGGNLGSLMGLLLWCKLNMCLRTWVGASVYPNVQSLRAWKPDEVNRKEVPDCEGFWTSPLNVLVSFFVFSRSQQSTHGIMNKMVPQIWKLPIFL